MNIDDGNSSTKWAVVIFTSRESLAVLTQAVQAATVAAFGKADIDVLVNGNPSLATDLAAQIGQQMQSQTTPAVRVRVWSVAVGDKANAWNQYIQRIWNGEEISFFIDGYVRLNPDAVGLLGEAVRSHKDVLGGTGVPTVGRTAAAMRRQMMESGGFHGNFCCIKGAVIEQLRRRAIRLPLGLYRVDSLMGAFLSFGLQPELGVWDHRRILIHPQATWQTDPKRWWRWTDLRAKVKQLFRQSRGVLENAAVKHHFVARKQSPERLLPTAAALVLDWATRCPSQLKALLWHNPLARRELAEIRRSRSGAAADQAPVLVASYRLP